jgi:hypothetical protein
VTHCSRCGKLLVPSAKDPVVALSHGTFDWKCYRADQEERRAARAEEEKTDAERRAARAEVSRARMNARWAERKGS